MQRPIPDLDEVRRLYSEGLYLQAYEASQVLGRLDQWQGTEARVLAGRLAAVLGGGRLGNSIHLCNYRKSPGDLASAFFAASTRLIRRGPWAAQRIISRHGVAATEQITEVANWHALRAQIVAMWRDFERATDEIDKALSLTPDRPWVHVAHAQVLELADRVDEARAAVERSLELQPWYRPAIQNAAHLYQLQGQPERAIDLLEQACQRLECGDLQLQLSDLKLEHGDPAGALAALDAAERLLPLADEPQRELLAARRCEAAYQAGDEARAVSAGKDVKHPFYLEATKNLEAATAGDKRVVLPVPFVRQHHLTCAPATLTSLSKFWNAPVDHLQISEEICFDGTPDHSQRRWAEQSGFEVREFTVDRPTAMALIDRGLPFAFTTVEVSSAHLQAAVGYDARRGTLLLRDPSRPRLQEILGEMGLKHYRGFGPRGMVLVPGGKRDLLAEVSLPDAELYDDVYRAQRSLEENARGDAVAAIDRLTAQDPQHRLTLAARMMLANYDSDPTTRYRVYEEWSTQFPENESLLYAKIVAMRNVLPRRQQIEILEEVCATPACDPTFRLYLAEELLVDARCHDRVRQQLRKARNVRPLDAGQYFALANLAWGRRDFDKALELYRIAACLDETREYCTQRYFAAARERGHTSEALDWLTARARRFAKKSSEPAQTLYWALSLIDRTEDAFAVLEEFRALRADDASLLLFAAESYGRCGKFEEAEAALQACANSAHRGRWWRTAAQVARYRGEPRQALEFWRQIAEQEPQSAEAAVGVAELQRLIEGRETAVAELRSKLAQFPENVELLRAAIEWWRNPEPRETLEWIDRLIDHNPGEPWVRRERALALLRSEQFDEARNEALLAIEIMPADSWGHSILGAVELKAGHPTAAASSYRRAIELNVDNDSAMHGLIETGTSHVQRAAELEFLYKQLVKQTTLGDGLASYAVLAKRLLDPAALLGNLRAALDARPDLWQAWSVVVQQLIEMRRTAEALELARQATDRFPLLPGAWLDRAAACESSGDSQGEIEALERCNELNRNWPLATFRLVDAHSRQGDFQRAKAVVEQALTRMPLDSGLHGYLADACRHLKLHAQAMLALRRAVELTPDYAWAWESLQSYGAELGQQDAAAKAARRLVERQPGNARGWYWLARVLTDPEQAEQRLAAIERAIELDVDSTDAHVFHSQLLAAAGETEAALQACRPAVFGERVPLELQVQELEIEAGRGELTTAIERLQKLLQNNADYSAGWDRLARWSADLEGHADTHLGAVQMLVRLEPLSSGGWAQLGDAWLKSGDRGQSREAFSRALELAPHDRYCGAMLFDLQADDLLWEAAEDTLAVVRRGGVDPWMTARAVRLAVARHNRAQALAAFEELCTTPCDGDWPVSFAFDQMRIAGWIGPARKLIAKYSTRPRNNYVLAEQVGVLLARKQLGHALKLLARIPEETFDWREAAARLLTGWPVGGKRRRLRKFLDRYRQTLRNETRLWAKAGYALVQSGQYGEAMRWMSDWRLRKDIETWMLLNVVVSLYELRREQEASEVSHAALEYPADGDTPLHRLWLTSWAAQTGHFAAAREGLHESAELKLNEFYRVLRTTADAAVMTDDDLKKRPDASMFRVLWTFWRRKGLITIHGDRTMRRIQARSVRATLDVRGRRRAGRLLEWLVNRV